MNINELRKIAKTMVAPGKGILAADESFGTIEKRFTKINLPSNEENRRAYREMLFTTPGIGQYISSVIMFDETIRQSTKDGKSFVKVLQEAGMLPGIKVDQGTEAMGESPDEKVTKGLDGLAERLKKYVGLGANFTKWRAVITIGENLPTDANIRENCKRLAQFAKLSQEAGLVPMVEPEVLMDGAHDIKACSKATKRTLEFLFEELNRAGVEIEGTILKTNMVLPGKESSQKATPQEIAEATIKVFKQVLPDNLPGEAFLSGGQSEKEATENLNAMNKMGKLPWQLGFSYGRALQDSALKTWNGKAENVEAAQQRFLHRAKMNSLARSGEYTKEAEGIHN